MLLLLYKGGMMMLLYTGDMMLLLCTGDMMLLLLYTGISSCCCLGGYDAVVVV